MPKRFIDTELDEQDWYSDLSVSYKLVWGYIQRHCDHAGVWRININVARRDIGIESQIDIEDFIKECNADGQERVLRVNGKRLFLVGFIKFQYANKKNELSESNKTVKSALEIIEGLGLDRGILGATIHQDNTFKGVKVKVKDILSSKEYVSFGFKSDHAEEFIRMALAYQLVVQKYFPNHSPVAKDHIDSTVIAGALELEKVFRLDHFEINLIKKVLEWTVNSYVPTLSGFQWLPNLISLASIRKQGSNSQRKFENILGSYESESGSSDFTSDDEIVNFACPDGHDDKPIRAPKHIHSICTKPDCRKQRVVVDEK